MSSSDVVEHGRQDSCALETGRGGGLVSREEDENQRQSYQAPAIGPYGVRLQIIGGEVQLRRWAEPYGPDMSGLQRCFHERRGKGARENIQPITMTGSKTRHPPRRAYQAAVPKQ